MAEDIAKLKLLPTISGIEVVDEHGDEWRFDVLMCASSRSDVGLDDLHRLDESPNEWIALASGNKIRGCKIRKNG